MEAPQHPAGTSNPFHDELARANSNYAAFRKGRLSRVGEPARGPSPVTEFVHDAVRALILNPRFSCLAAKASVRQGSYRFAMYGRMGSPEATAGLARDLYSFVEEQPRMGSGFTTFITSFEGPTPADEEQFEAGLWEQLQRLHDRDALHHGWDPGVSADPGDPEFSFSFAGRAFFVVGMHPASSRWTRRFAWPTLVFNAHHQFDDLRARGKYHRFRDLIRARERALQGDVNPVLRDFGEQSEAVQYSGREVEPGWVCPFHRRESHPPADIEPL